MASIEERFQAAVNVIKGLPKNGPYQPSTTMMLKFYGFYKQATEGSCHQKRPGFWDVVGRAKWDAWNGNRHLTKQQAMQKYVDDLREIIETMSFTENVQNFVGSISGLDNINLDELDMIVPGMRELAESHPNSPFNSRTNSPQHGASANGIATEKSEQMNKTAVPLLNGHSKMHLNGLSNGVHSSSEEAEDDLLEEQQQHNSTASSPNFNTQSLATVSMYATSNGNIDQSDDEYGDPVDMQHDFTEAMIQNSELLKQVQATVLRMNADLVNIHQRMGVLEKTVQEVRAAVHKPSKSSARGGAVRSHPKWWPFEDISPAWFILLVLWPFLVRRISRMLITQRRN